MTSGMLAVLASAAYAVFAAGTRSAQKARLVNSMVAAGTRSLTAMAADIRAAVEHDGVRLTSLDVQYEGLDADTIDFVATRTRRALDDSEAAGRCEVGYYIDNDPETEAQWLLRREDPAPDDDPLEGGSASPAGPGVAELNLEFFDGLEWAPGWEDQERFPAAVRIDVVVVDPSGRERPLLLETTVSIPAR